MCNLPPGCTRTPLISYATRICWLFVAVTTRANHACRADTNFAMATQTAKPPLHFANVYIPRYKPALIRISEYNRSLMSLEQLFLVPDQLHEMSVKNQSNPPYITPPLSYAWSHTGIRIVHVGDHRSASFDPITPRCAQCPYLPLVSLSSFLSPCGRLHLPTTSSNQTKLHTTGSCTDPDCHRRASNDQPTLQSSTLKWRQCPAAFHWFFILMLSCSSIILEY